MLVLTDTPLFTLTPTIYMSVPYVNTFSPLSSALIVILPVDVSTFGVPYDELIVQLMLVDVLMLSPYWFTTS